MIETDKDTKMQNDEKIIEIKFSIYPDLKVYTLRCPASQVGPGEWGEKQND